MKYSPGGQPTYFPDVVIGGGGGILYHRSADTPQPDVYVDYSVPLVESAWSKRPDSAAQSPARWSGQPATTPRAASLDVVTREDMMKVLQDLEYIRVRVLYDSLAQSSSIRQIKLGTAVSENTGQGLASRVEQCICPPGYEGLSCEKCASGYEREAGQCVQARLEFLPQVPVESPGEESPPQPGAEQRVDCDPNGSVYPQADPRTGQCVCKVSGDTFFTTQIKQG